MSFFSKLKDHLFGGNSDTGEKTKNTVRRRKSIEGAEFLIHANSEIEASIIEAKLNSYGIPVLKEYDGSGLYSRIITGGALLGAEIYVPAALVSEAREIISQEEEISQ